MRAILIDAFEQTVTELDVKGDLESIYAALRCSMIETAAEFVNGDTMYVDEEGLLKEALRGFTLRRAPALVYPVQQFLAGSGLIIGTGPDGESAPAKTEFKDVQSLAVFMRAPRGL